MSDRSTAPDRRMLFGLTRDAWGALTLIDADGARHVGVSPVPMFPLTDPDRWIALCDRQGRELVCVEAPEDLPAEPRRVLREELSRRHFVPTLRRILRVSGNTEPCEWEVDTDRGRTRFVLPSEDHVRRLSAHQVLVIDANGIRYLVPDLRALDARSRRIVEWHL